MLTSPKIKKYINLLEFTKIYSNLPESQIIKTLKYFKRDSDFYFHFISISFNLKFKFQVIQFKNVILITKK